MSATNSGSERAGLLLCRMWAFLRLKDTVVKTILDDAAALEHPTQRVRDNLLLPMSTLATWVIFGVGNLPAVSWPNAGLPAHGLLPACREVTDCMSGDDEGLPVANLHGYGAGIQSLMCVLLVACRQAR